MSKLSDVIKQGLRSAQPLATAVGTGTLYFVTDEQVIEQSDGSSWSIWSNIHAPFKAPTDASYAWINQGGASVTAATYGGILLSGPATAGDSIRVRKKTNGGAGSTLTVQMQAIAGKRATATYGIGFRESGSGKLHLLMCNHYDSGTIYSIKFTDATTFSATYTSTVMNTLNEPSMPPRWLRVADTGGNRVCSYSVDGFSFTQFHSIGRTDFLTADEFLFFVNASDASVATSARLLSWIES